MKRVESLEREYEEAMRRIIADKETPFSALLAELAELREEAGIPAVDSVASGIFPR